MIITQDKQKQVVQSHDFESVNCTIDAEDMRYVASLLRNNYSNPILAVIREISANALDANAEANSSRQIEITLPSNLNPRFIVRDFGDGLSKEDVFGLYSKYGKSTKRTSNNYIGAFGIGKFAPLSYGDNFTCVSHHNGIKSSYNIFVNEDDDTKIVEIGKGVPSNEPSGMSVEVAVADSDVNTFREVAGEFFRFFPKEDLPKFIGVGDDEEFLKPYNVIMEGDNWFIIEQKRHGYNYGHHHESHAMMGRVSYPIVSHSINVNTYLTEAQKTKGYERQLKALLAQDNLYIKFNIGQLKLHHSREAIEYNKATQKEIVSVLLEVRKQIGEIAKEKLSNAEDIWDAKAKYAQVINSLPYNLRDIFENAFEWNGSAVKSMTFDRDYKYQDDILITEYYKEDDVDSTDGYRIRSQKNSRINPTENTALVIQDMKSPHGNALRARTLFKNDDTLQGAVFVRCTTQDAEDHLYDVDGMQFNLVKKDRFNFTSEIEKAKLQSRGKAVRGESRSDVAFFELDWEKTNHHYRNTDYWLNCTENIDDLEESDKTLIYVPISNYKVVEENATGQEESITLNSLVNDVNAILKLHKNEDDSFDKDNVLVLGVRRKDCSKLDKTLWSNWQEYKIDFCKKYVTSRKSKIIDSEKALAFNNNNVNMEDYSNLSALLESSTFLTAMEEGLEGGHCIMQVVGDIKLMRANQTSEITTLGRMITFLRNHAEEWAKKNIPSNYDINEFNDNCKKVCKQYPLLVNIASCGYSYRNYGMDNFGKNIVDYVLMCDLV